MSDISDEPADRGDEDLASLIARHLDGGLDVEAQRRLARRLAASAEARRTLADFMRLEGAVIRLARAGQLGSAAAAPGAEADAAAPRPTVEPRHRMPPVPRRRWLVSGAALAGGLVVAVLVIAGLRSGRPALPGGGDLERVAEQWLRLRNEPSSATASMDDAWDPAVAAAGDPEVHVGDDIADGVPPDEPAPGPRPPAWLVAALADHPADDSVPDDG